MSVNTTFRGIDHIGEAQLSEQLETNLSHFFSWGFLSIGSFFNVEIPDSGVYGGNFHTLRRVDDPYYSAGQVWEGTRRDWIWETGVDYEYQPIDISGVYVDGDFYPAGTTGVYAHTIDYPNGRIIFDSAIATTSTVTCEYSYRQYHITTADVPWFRDFQFDSFRPDLFDHSQVGSGAWSILSQNRIQLPALIVEAVPRTNRRPLELGNYSTITTQDVLVHCVGETRDDVLKAHDIITGQWGYRIKAYDKNLVYDNNAFPLNAGGSRASGAMMYPDFVQPTGNGGFAWRQVRFSQTQGLDYQVRHPFYYSLVRVACELDIP